MPLRDVLGPILFAATGSESVDRALGAVALFAIIASILALFLIVFIVITVLRRRHYRTEKPDERAETQDTDAWTEAGRRVQPDARRDAQT